MLTTLTNQSLDSALISDEFMRDPYPLMRQMQAEAPVYWSETIGGWIVTRYDDVLVTFRDVAHFSNEGRLGKAVEYLPPEQRANFGAFESHYASRSLIHSDPPDHTRLRGLMNKVFTPRAVEALRPRIQELVEALLDAAPSSGPIDIIRVLASPLPATVIAQIVGAPAEEAHLFKIWADDILAFQGLNRPPLEVLARAQRGIVDMRAYLTDLIAQRRRQPQDDLLSSLVAVESEGERLSPDELVSTCVTLLVAGHETTMSLIGNGLLSLLQNPEQLQQLRADPRLLPSAIEEMLRFESPVARQPRFVKEDVTLGGQSLRQGQIAFQFLNAANRDEAYFPDPDRFDVRRPNNKHIAFGNGVHFCIGAPLARIEGPIAIAAVLRRMPNLWLADDGADWDIGKPNSRLLRSLNVLG
jgi:cytochrome P450